jgi:hypothetical protein
MNPDQKMVATIGLVLILFVVFGVYKGALTAIFFGAPSQGSTFPSGNATVPQGTTNPTGTSPVINGFNPNLGGINLPTVQGPPAPSTIGLGGLSGVTV